MNAVPMPSVQPGKVGLDPSTQGKKDHRASEQGVRVRLWCLSQDQGPS